jgi:hypothetical protein
MNFPAKRSGPVMSKADVARLLTYMASLDPYRDAPGDADVQAWHPVAATGRWTLPFAIRAVVEFHADATTDRLRPGHITQAIRDRRQTAVSLYKEQDYPAGMFNTDDQIRWQESRRAAFIARYMDAWAAGEIA